MTNHVRHMMLGLGLLLLSGTAGAADVSLELWATRGQTTLPNAVTTPVLGYATTSGGLVTVPGGPVLIVTEGDTVTVTLFNGLLATSGVPALPAEDTSLHFQGQAMTPDPTIVAPGASRVYTFVAATPGTFLYEAGLAPGTQHQAARGLHGALVVRAATPGQAYADPATAYDDEAVLVLSELDPTLNGSTTPATFDLQGYRPRYFLINGRAHPATDRIGTGAARKVLLRYVNAGLQHHSMTVLGMQQLLVGKDGNPITHPGQRVAETIAPGETLDAIAVVPAGAGGQRFPLYDGSLMLTNNGGSDLGGMLTFLEASGVGGGAPGGPATSGVVLSPAVTNGTTGVAITATVASATTPIAAAEYFLDAPGASGTGTPMQAADSGFNSSTEAVTGTISTTTLATIPSGAHTVYVHGQDTTLAWGAFNFAVLSLDRAGPVTSGLAVTPNPNNGTGTVALGATANDAATGNGNIDGAEYTVDGGAAVPMTVTPSNAGGAGAAVAALTATVPVDGLSGGPHTIGVRSRDALGNWGAVVITSLLVDNLGPVTGAVSMTGNASAVRVTATLADAASAVTAAEGFIDTVGTIGTGFRFIPSDGLFDGLTETGYVDIPLSTIKALTSGNHFLRIRGKDAAGNWGTPGSTLILVALNDTLGITANNNAVQTNSPAPSVLANDPPVGGAGRTAALLTPPVKTSGATGGTLVVTCGNSSTPGICANGTYRWTLVGTGNTGAARATSKRGTYQFKYTLNGNTAAPATVTVTVR